MKIVNVFRSLITDIRDDVANFYSGAVYRTTRDNLRHAYSLLHDSVGLRNLAAVFVCDGDNVIDRPQNRTTRELVEKRAYRATPLATSP
jgi:hypothetical protein